MQVIKGRAVSQVYNLKIAADLLSYKELVVVTLVAFWCILSVIYRVVGLDVAIAYIHGLVDRIIKMSMVIV